MMTGLQTPYIHQDDCLVLAVVLASAFIKEEMSFGSGLQFFRSKHGEVLDTCGDILGYSI
jgi:hypothetical protein